MSKRNDLISEHYRINYVKLVKRTINRVPHNSSALAEEVVQEAYTRALKYYRTFDPSINNFNIWFMSILRNATKDCKAHEGNSGVSREVEENDTDIHITLEEKMALPVLTNEILATKSKDHQALKLFYLYSYSTKEIAEYLGTNPNNVRQIIYRFRSKVEQMFDVIKGIH